MTTASKSPLADSIALAAARLEQLREELRNTPIYMRHSQAFLSKTAERQNLLARLEALRRLQSLEK
jgi:hypothetical protein